MLSRDIGEENSKCAVRAVFTLLPMNNYRLGLKLGLALLFTDECYWGFSLCHFDGYKRLLTFT